MEKDKKILSDITVYNKYARYIPEQNRRETWDELVDRNRDMHIRKYPQIKSEIERVYDDFVRTKKVLPSMRSMQFGGKAIEVTNARIYNCAFLPIDSIRSFAETMFLLLNGCGVGYSVQSFNIGKLPSVQKPNPNRKRKFLVQDDIIGWADAIKALLKSYMGKTTSTLVFDYSAIREKGALLITSGGRAPGAGPLKVAITKIENILSDKKDGERLSSVDCHDICCHIADAVLSGGIRRAAMISLFDKTDNEMITCKSGNWWELNPQRGRANNSVVLVRSDTTKEEFDSIWNKVELSGAGEPGFYFTENERHGTNPCCEIALKPHGFCNLTEINASTVTTQEELNSRSRAASFIGTLQAGYTDFHYLNDEWKKNAEEEALLGVSMTGIANKSVLALDFSEASEEVLKENRRVANLIGINCAKRTTCVKPAGTTSLVLGTSSGIHAWHNDFYIRRMRVGKNEALYTYLSIYHPELIEDEVFSPETTAVISVPQKAPEGAITRHENVFDLLERVKSVSTEWVKVGHVEGDNTHNVSCTISIKEGEWNSVGEWMWENRGVYNGISVLPYDGGTYAQTPFEDCSEEVYKKMMQTLQDIDLSKVVETEDNTNLKEQAACSGGACEII